MEHKNNSDEIDKFLFDYFENEKEEPIPDYVYKSINNTIKKIKSKNNYFRFVKKIAVIITSIGILTTSAVFAKEFIHYISSLFTNTTEAINTAVENDYIQELNMEYIYDKDIGISLEYILLDDSNFDLSLIYKYVGNETVDEIVIDDFILKNDTGTILWERTKDIRNNLMEVSSLTTINNAVNIEKNIYRDSLLITSKQFSEFNRIIIEINSLKLKIGEQYIIQDGKWILESQIDKNKLNREKLQYNIEENEYVKNSLIQITETSLKIQLEFYENINQELIKNIDNVILIDTAEKKYKYKSLDLYNNKILVLEYEISKFSENIDKFILQMVAFKEKNIELKFYR